MTKTVEYFVDLAPGWQDLQYTPYMQPNSSLELLSPVCKRMRVLVELPCFGGSALTTETVTAKTEEQK